MLHKKRAVISSTHKRTLIMVAAVSISAPETNTNDSSRNISQTHHLAVKAAKTNKGKRAIEKNAPRRKEVAAKTLMLLHGAVTSEVLKSLINDLSQMKYGENHKMNRKNPGIRPFEGGGEVSLWSFSRRRVTRRRSRLPITKRRNDRTRLRLDDFITTRFTIAWR